MAHTRSPVRLIEDYGPAPLDDPAVYPGMWPSGPVMVSADAVVPVPHSISTTDRIAVLAIGSNANPAQIRRKGIVGEVLLMPTTLQNHLVVHAGHITTYGAVPATVVRWPQASCQVFVAWLTAQQVADTTISEHGNYDLVDLPTDHGVIPGYRARTGVLTDRTGSPVRLAAVEAHGPGLPTMMTQTQALAAHPGPVR